MLKRLAITGMSCGNCVRHVRDELMKLPGVRVEHADIESVTIEYDPGKVSLEKVRSAIVEAGYQVQE
jgi:copper chaperone CopZ